MTRGLSPLPNLRELLSITHLAFRAHGFLFVVRRLAEYALSPVQWILLKIFRSHETFALFGKDYLYFHHPYNLTWTNERSVEIPVVQHCVRQHAGNKILEIGNVLSWYFTVHHDVVDKYERGARNVINVDIEAFHPQRKYDLIVSVSTLEHVGWDEVPRDPEKVLRVVRHLKTLLADGGQMVLTFPLGYNHALDRYLSDGALRFSNIVYLRRVSRRNFWVQADWEQVKHVRYDSPFRGANALAIAMEG